MWCFVTLMQIFRKLRRVSGQADPKPVSGWRDNPSHWPVSDRDGNWLISTRTERRALESGEYEYRASLDHLMLSESVLKP